MTNNLTFALMQNAAGNWPEATPETISVAAESIAGKLSSDLRPWITDASAPLAYPISSHSYLLLFQNQTDPEKVGAFGKSVKWVLHDGQNYAPAYGTIPQQSGFSRISWARFASRAA